MSSLRLFSKTFDNNQKLNKRPNNILNNFQKEKLDYKSCNETVMNSSFCIILKKKVIPNPDFYFIIEKK